jgi:hypothetical protein
MNLRLHISSSNDVIWSPATKNEPLLSSPERFLPFLDYHIIVDVVTFFIKSHQRVKS